MSRNNIYYLSAISISIILIIAGWFISKNKLEMQSSATNILKLTKVEKIESALINSDFYFRLSKYKNGKVDSEYSELVPITTTISYDISNLTKTNLTLPIASINSSVKRKDRLYFLDNHSNRLIKPINGLKNFSKIYGEIVSTQDPDYIIHADNHAKKILKNVFGLNTNTVSTKKQDYYKIITTPLVPNLKIEYFKKYNTFNLSHISKKEWNPDIATWKNKSGSFIHLQLLKNTKKTTIGKVIQSMIAGNDILLARISNHNSNYASTVYFTWRKGKNSIKSYFLDESNGNIYILILNTNHITGIINDLDDYLTIAMGFSFHASEKANKYTYLQNNVLQYRENFCSDKFLDDIKQHREIYAELVNIHYLNITI
jgi:hypothetical protein